jgi:hypothetical protein
LAFEDKLICFLYFSVSLLANLPPDQGFSTNVILKTMEMSREKSLFAFSAVFREIVSIESAFDGPEESSTLELDGYPALSISFPQGQQILISTSIEKEFFPFLVPDSKTSDIDPFLKVKLTVGLWLSCHWHKTEVHMLRKRNLRNHLIEHFDDLLHD